VLFTAEEIACPLSLTDERAKHIRSVLHKTEGDSFEAGVIGGMAGSAHITRIDDHGSMHGGAHGTLCFTFTPRTDGKPLYPVKMLIGFPRPIQLKRLFRDMAGIGVAEIHLAGTELGEKSYMQSNLFERGTAEALLRDGSAQAKSTHVPRLFLHKTLADCLNEAAGDTAAPEAHRFALDIAAEIALTDALREKIADGLAAWTPQGIIAPVWAAIGSERGWTDGERELLKGAGFTLVSMGNRVLRTETAATVAAALLLSAMGVL